MRMLFISVLLALVLTACGNQIELRLVPADGISHTEDELQHAEKVLLNRFLAYGIWVNDSQIVENSLSINVLADSLEDIPLDDILAPAFLEVVDFSDISPDIRQLNELQSAQIRTTAQIEYGLDNPDARNNPNTGEPFVTILTPDLFIGLRERSVLSSGALLASFSLNEQGSEIFYEFTESHIGKSVGIVLNGHVIDYPTVMAAISEQIAIVGLTNEDVDKLTRLIPAGIFPFPLILEGQDE